MTLRERFERILSYYLAPGVNVTLFADQVLATFNAAAVAAFAVLLRDELLRQRDAHIAANAAAAAVERNEIAVL